MKKIFQKTRGSFLADIMVSMGILTMSITASLTLINQSITTNSVNKNKVIAVNLAREGLEGVRLIRDTNWFRYGTKKRICWNFWNNTNQDDEWSNSSDSTCKEGTITEGANGVNEGTSGYNMHPIGVSIKDKTEELKIGIKSYLLNFDEVNYNWTLVENFRVIPDNWSGNSADQIKSCADSSLTTIHVDGLDDNRFPMGLDECSATDNNDGKWADREALSGITSRLYLNTDGFYTHKALGNTPTDFYREVFIEYPLGKEGFHPILSEEDINTMKAIDNQILVTVKVWYRGHGGIMRKVTLETEFTDYLERTNWSE